MSKSTANEVIDKEELKECECVLALPDSYTEDGEPTPLMKRVVIPPCPIKIWQGTADTITDPAMVQEFVDSVHRSGSYAELHLLEGVGHGVNEVMKEEQLLWFNRFV